MEIVYVVILVVVGLIVAVLETFIPSFGVLAVVSFATLASAVYLAFTTINPVAGWVTLAAVIVITPTLVILALNYFPNLPIGKWFVLAQKPKPVEERVGITQDLSHLMDAEGVALSQLRPSGMGQFGEERISVVTRGELVEKDARIKVIKAFANHVIVKEIKN